MNTINTRLEKIEDEVKAIREELNKNEPVFKVGDWVTLDSTTYRSEFTGRIASISGDRFSTLEPLGSLRYCSGWSIYAFRKATKEEILNKIAKYEVGEEVWSNHHGNFATIASRSIDNCDRVAYNVVSGILHTSGLMESDFEKRPQQKFKVGDRVISKSHATPKPYTINYIYWWGGKWLYAEYPEDSFNGWSQDDSNLELYIEPKKRIPKSGQIWKYRDNYYLLLQRTNGSLQCVSILDCDTAYLGDFHIDGTEEYICDFNDFNPKEYI